MAPTDGRGSRWKAEGLFGFTSSDEKEFFKQLLSVKGIGPKSALAILASGNASDIATAIDNGDDVDVVMMLMVVVMI